MGIQYTINNEKTSHKGLVWNWGVGSAFVMLLHNNLHVGDKILMRFQNGYGCVSGVITRAGMDGYGIKFDADENDVANLEVMLKNIILTGENPYYSSLFNNKSANQFR